MTTKRTFAILIILAAALTAVFLYLAIKPESREARLAGEIYKMRLEEARKNFQSAVNRARIDNSSSLLNDARAKYNEARKEAWDEYEKAKERALTR